ncbi:MAG: LysM peptidoglycan-binding domain-containing protein, partial [Phycisphaerae bacterium]
MTKETKIGLIVGLAFIILFAIILSEKGAQNTPKAPSALTLADAGTEKAHATGDPEEPLSDAGRLPIRSEPAGGGIQGTALRSDRGKNERPVGRPIPGEDEPIMPLPESVVNRLNLQMEETEVALDDPANPTPVSPAASDAPMSVSDAVASALTASPHEAHPSRTENGATRSRASATHNPGGVAPAESTVFDRPSPAETMKIIARHRVMPGESLGKIAARYYGRATPSRINALFDANRDTLASIHTIRADTLLKIPPLDPAEQ